MYLCHFYGSIQTTKGKHYSHSGYISIHAGINCHLCEPPFLLLLDISRDKEFMAANDVLVGSLQDVKQQGQDIMKHKQALSARQTLLNYMIQGCSQMKILLPFNVKFLLSWCCNLVIGVMMGWDLWRKTVLWSRPMAMVTVMWHWVLMGWQRITKTIARFKMRKSNKFSSKNTDALSPALKNMWISCILHGTISGNAPVPVSLKLTGGLRTNRWVWTLAWYDERVVSVSGTECSVHKPLRVCHLCNSLVASGLQGMGDLFRLHLHGTPVSSELEHPPATVSQPRVASGAFHKFHWQGMGGVSKTHMSS